MTYDTAVDIIDELDENTKGDDALQKLRRQLHLNAIQYARIRTDWFMMPREGRLDVDHRRSAAHNALIDACNILCRAMAKSGRATNWRRIMGEDRKEIGDFACHLHCVLGIKAR